MENCQLIQTQVEQLHAGEYVRQILFDELASLERERLGGGAFGEEIADTALRGEDVVVLQPGQRLDHGVGIHRGQHREILHRRQLVAVPPDGGQHLFADEIRDLPVNRIAGFKVHPAPRARADTDRP